MCNAAGATHSFKKVFHAENNSLLPFLDYQLCIFSVTTTGLSHPSSHLKLNTHSLNTPQCYDNRVITDLYVGERGKGSEGVWIQKPNTASI